MDLSDYSILNMKGNYEFNIDDKKVGFRFGTYSLSISMKKNQCSSLGEFFEKVLSQDLQALLDLFYGAAVHYASHKKIVVDFNDSDVSDWIDEIGFDKSTEMMMDMIKQYNPKNSQPPATGDQMVTNP